MRALLVPTTEGEAADMVRAAAAAGRRLAIAGGHTRSGFGHAAKAEAMLRTAGLAGIVAYDPAEMVMTVKAGTPVAEVEEALAENGQMLSFEPIDHRGLMGTEGEPTMGGLFACNASGPRRIAAGAARDSLLGIRFVNGMGEVIRAGGRVMKNVTGLDLVKLLAGSFGTLGLMTEVTFRVLPRPQTQETLVLSGLADEDAARAMALAMSLPLDVSGAAHLPESVRGRFLGRALPEGAATVFRLEGLTASVPVRTEKLAAALASLGPLQRLDAEDSAALWREIRDVAPYADQSQRPLWRVSVAPMAGAALVAQLRLEAGIDAFYDWQGGLVWMRMEADPEADLLRQMIRRHGGGHATLLRAPDAIRQSVPAFEPLPAPLAALTERVRASLDPAGVFNSGMMIKA
ncbi:glycolate oxidase subunit GlcE [Rhizobium sp. SSA_523]|uniref:glycolate oxidase subunit GlcE n=1 Tax=Rhizobium sp. SSA_523 TaxID=2952477 RepID=UPI002091071E|nr:glycolate oxidase subunit GlcE [Rhizobium sp. SSA_523]MCO5733162.1 glycolate oxidase subunit GlcE [Rhizobium sp. SSA_523]WKC24034.1 glycolate oxidase subunit GlcE [Rhizobium sp. SSA_523]